MLSSVGRVLMLVKQNESDSRPKRLCPSDRQHEVKVEKPTFPVLIRSVPISITSGSPTIRELGDSCSTLDRQERSIVKCSVKFHMRRDPRQASAATVRRVFLPIH